MSSKGNENKQSKLKEKLAVGIKPLSVLFFCASLVSIVLRTLQMTKYIDSETGFYTGGKAIAVVLYAVLGISALVFCGVSYVSRDCAKLSFYNKENKTVGCVTALMSLAFFIDSFSSFGRSVDSLNYSTASQYTSLMTSGAVPQLIQSIFALLSAIFFIILAKDMIKGKASASNRKILATMPVWWAGARLIHRFLRQISFIEISDLLLELLMVGAMVIFFMALAQVVSGVYSDGFRWRVFAMGYTAALLALATSIPRLVLSFVQGGAFINAQHPFYLCDLVFALFALTLIIYHKPSDETAEENAEVTAE